MAVGTQVSGKELNRKLRDHFGFRQFRPGQERAVQSAMDGRDTVVVMPTGSGKSVCFQLPALALVGTTVVVSPLIAAKMMVGSFAAAVMPFALVEGSGPWHNEFEQVRPSTALVL